MVPLVQCLGVWLPKPSHWLLRTIRLGYAIQFARRPPQVQRHPLHISEGGRCSCLACGDRSFTGEGCDRAGPSSQYEDGVLQPLFHCTQERRWVTSGLGPACLEPGPSPVTVQDVGAETHHLVASPILCQKRGHRRLPQDTGRGSIRGTLVGFPIHQSLSVATASVPPLSGRVTGSVPQRKPEYALHLLRTYT